MPVDIFRSSFTEFTVLYYQDWTVTMLGKDTISPGEDLHWDIYNPEEQEVMVTADVASLRMAEQGCQDDFSLTLWATEGEGHSYSSNWNRMD